MNAQQKDGYESPADLRTEGRTLAEDVWQRRAHDGRQPHPLSSAGTNETQAGPVGGSSRDSLAGAGWTCSEIGTFKGLVGLFGPIFEATFRIQKQTTLSYSHESFKLTSLPDRDELFGGADGVLGFSLPYSDRIVVERRRVLGETARISAFSRLTRSLRDRLWENKASFFATLLPYNWFFGILDRLISLSLIGLSWLGGFRGRPPTP